MRSLSDHLRLRLRGADRWTRTQPPAAEPESWSAARWSDWAVPRPGGWSTVATLGAGAIADVDDRGRIALRARPLSIEFWFGAGDRWFLPSSHAGTVRQRRVDGLPIIESRTRVGEDDVIVTVWADEPGDGRGRVVVRAETETDEPVVLAVVVRPFTRDAVGRIERLRVAENLVIADQVPVVVLPRPPGDVVVGSLGIGDVAGRLGDSLHGDEHVDAPDGSATLACMLPLVAGRDMQLQVIDGRDAPSITPAPLDRTIAGWQRHLADVADVALPGWPKHLWTSLTSGVLAAVADTRPGSAMASPRRAEAPFAATAHMAALAGIGLHWAAAEILTRLVRDVNEGRVGPEHWFLITAAAARLRLDGDTIEIVRRDGDIFPRLVGESLTAGCASGDVGALRRLVSVAAGERALADAELIEAVPAGPERLADLALLGARLDGDQWRELQRTEVHDTAPVFRLALETLASARTLPTERFDAAAVDPLPVIRRLADPTWSWRVEDDADSVVARAVLITAVLSTVVDDGLDGCDVVPGFTEAWLGRPVDVARLPIRWGSLSFSIRWHGERPALLWEFTEQREPEEGRDFRVSARRLDPTFVSENDSGEALLDAPSWAVVTSPAREG